MKSFFASAIVFILFAQFTFSQNEYSPKVQIWQVDAETAPCNGIKGGECLLIKQSGKKTFEIFDEKIDGFSYENGFSYTISVKMQLKEPPIAVGESMYKYVLVNVISKKGIATNSTYPTTTSTTSSVRTIEVNYELVTCEEDDTKTCLLIREKEKKEFEILNKRIDGFEFQPGYSYVINIVEDKSGNYFLIKELSKKFVQSSTAKYNPIGNTKETKTYKNPNGKIIGQPTLQTSSTLDGKWYLRKMKETEGSSFVTDDNIMWIDIKTFTDRIDGFGACNNFSTVVKSDLKTTFEISKLTTNFSFCGNKKIEDLFYDLLQQTNKFEIRNGNLFLSKQWNNLLIFTSNPNNKEEIAEKYTKPAIVKSDNTTYATNEDLATKNAEGYNYQTTSTKEESVTETNENNLEVDEMQHKIEEMQKALAAKKQADAIDAKKEEQEKLAKQKADEQAEELRKKEEEAKQKALDEKAKLKAEKQKELERLQKEMDELDNPKSKSNSISSPNKQIVNNKKETIVKTTNETKNNNQSKIIQPEIKIVKTTENIQISTIPIEDVKINNENSITDNSIFPNPKLKDIVYYKPLNDEKLLFIEKTIGFFTGNSKNTYLEINNLESNIQFLKGKIPKLIIKTNGLPPSSDYITLYTCDFKKEKRQIYVRPLKNRVFTSYSEINPGVFEIVLPENLGEGEYIFVKQADLNNATNIIYNTSKLEVLGFGVIYK